MFFVFFWIAVTVVGYGTEDDNTDYWLIRNSWSSNWADHGYFKVERNNFCGMYFIMWTADV